MVPQSSDLIFALLVAMLAWSVALWALESAEADTEALGGADLRVVDAGLDEWDAELTGEPPTYSLEQLLLFDGRPGKDLVWAVEVDASFGEPLGINLVNSSVGAVAVKGLIAKWNSRNPFRAVRAGDSVVAVNGMAASPALLQYELAKRLVLRIGFARKTDGTILLALLGRVFDVSTGKDFYAPGQTYRSFAGHDCSHAMAIVSTKRKFLDMDLHGLEEPQLSHLNATFWETYVQKYPVIGVLADPPYDVSLYDRFVGPVGGVMAKKIVLHWWERLGLVYCWNSGTQKVMVWRNRSWKVTSFAKDWLDALPVATADQLWDVVPPGKKPPRWSIFDKITHTMHAIVWWAKIDAKPCR